MGEMDSLVAFTKKKVERIIREMSDGSVPSYEAIYNSQWDSIFVEAEAVVYYLEKKAILTSQCVFSP